MSKLRPLCMPKWGIEMTEGTIVEWMVGDGDQVKRGDVICLIETAKITNEVEAEQDAVVLRVVAPAGEEELPVGALLAVFGDETASSEEVDAFVAGFAPETSGVGEAPVASAGGGKEAEAAETRVAARTIVTDRPISPRALELASNQGLDLAAIAGSGRGGRITYQDVFQQTRPAAAPSWRGPADLVADDRSVFASPLARRLAARHGVDLAALTGTGPHGRISRRDVLGAAGQGSAELALVPNPPKVEPFDKVRTVIAQRLTAAKRDIPHFYLRIAVAADALLDLRKATNQDQGIAASINDYLVLAVAKALARHGDVNVQLHGDAVHRFAHADVAIAVDSPKGLVTPIVRQADRMTIAQLAAASSALVDKARAGRLAYEDLDGGTFTVSNLGMFGIDGFDAVINPPQGAILAVGRAQREPVAGADGKLAVASRIHLTLSVDHRAIDGAAGARFLATLKDLIENPKQLLG